MKNILGSFLMLSLFLFSFIVSAQTFTDSRDNQTYTYVQIGSQIWMSQNLNYQTSESWCYENNNTNCETYGRLYTFISAQQACPSGWRIPKDQDWEILVKYVGNKNMFGTKIIDNQNTLWTNLNSGIDNSTNFNLLPGGLMKNDNAFEGLNTNASLWSLFDDGSKGWGRHINTAGQFHSYENMSHKAYSLRCIKE